MIILAFVGLVLATILGVGGALWLMGWALLKFIASGDQ